MDAKKLLDEKNTTILIIVLFMAFILLAGITLFVPVQTHDAEDDDFFDSQFNNKNENENPEKKPCPAKHECCPGIWYEQKNCSEGTCEKFKCKLEKCAFECCDETGVEKKLCSGEKLCQNNKCVKQSCPFECCTSISDYKPKACNADHVCENNKCIQKECKNECCVNEIGVKEKPCYNNMECADGVCQKPECPNLCCPPNDPLYQEKKCLPHQVCLGRVCAPRI